MYGHDILRTRGVPIRKGDYEANRAPGVAGGRFLPSRYDVVGFRQSRGFNALEYNTHIHWNVSLALQGYDHFGRSALTGGDFSNMSARGPSAI